jgi:hypothetical protein
MPEHMQHQGREQNKTQHHGGHRKWPFLWGAQPQRIQIAAIPVTPGLKVPTVRVPKNGFLSAIMFRFVGSANVTTAGTAGNGNIFNLIQNYLLSYNGGFQYRNLDGESIYALDLTRNYGPDQVMGGPNFKTYASGTPGIQPIGFTMRDYVSLNTQANQDKYLLAAHARNADITIDITFAPNPNGTFVPIYGVGANTETAAITGTLYLEGLYLLDPPSYAKFDKPDLTRVQQIEVDYSYTQIVTGQNTISILPLNGPKYLQILLKAIFNGAPDSQGFASGISNFELKINNGLSRINMSEMALVAENINQLGRTQCGTVAAPNNAALPPGWYLFDFLNDVGINNAVSIAGRNVISTERIASLWLMPTVMTGVNLTANNMFKIVKRSDLPAVGGTNKLTSPHGE